jgi:1,2-phenylacetyl-CoA epoxidase PaaB subunit
MMSTYEVETVFYNNHGGVQTKNYDLFSSKQQAVKHMNSQIKSKTYLVQRGKIKDGSVQLVDENGKVKEQLSLGQL